MDIKVLACRDPGSELRWVFRTHAVPPPIQTRFQVPKLMP